MANIAATRPEADEYAPYYEKYISLVPQGDVVNTMRKQRNDTLTLLRNLSEKQADSRYAPGKWSLKEVVGHIIDTERIFSHRAFRFARNDQTPLPGYEQDDYVREGDFGSHKLTELAADFEYVRRATLSLYSSFNNAAWRRRGVANDNEVSVRAIAHIITGHEAHHMQIIRTKYLN